MSMYPNMNKLTAEMASQLPKDKQTTSGLYVTAAQTYEAWKAAQDQIKVIDVRIPEEYALVGHPEMAWNIPLAFKRSVKDKYKIDVEVNVTYATGQEDFYNAAKNGTADLISPPADTSLTHIKKSMACHTIAVHKDLPMWSQHNTG